MIDDFTVRSVFRAHIKTVDGIPDKDNLAWEKKTFTPTQGTPWMRETLLRAGERLRANDETEQNGVMQFDYFIPLDESYSLRAAEELATAIKKAFKTGTHLGNSVRTVGAEVGRGRPSGAWYQIPITISYTAFGNNQ